MRSAGTVEGGTKMRQNSSSSSNNDDRKSHISSTFYIGSGYPEDAGQHPRSSDTELHGHCQPAAQLWSQYCNLSMIVNYMLFAVSTSCILCLLSFSPKCQGCQRIISRILQTSQSLDTGDRIIIMKEQ